MNSVPPVDPAMVLSEATSSDLVRRKLDMDALRKRLGDQSSKEEKLRESCEGFEAIFLQKMWEQMRKNVPKEGYLHSKDEETYQSLFDVELCKKMASAGGIGLADMLYEQLSQQLENSGRTTSPSTYRRPLDIEASGSLMAAAPAAAPATTPAPARTDRPLKAEDLYEPLPEEEEPQDSPDQVQDALEELRAALDESGEAVREWAEARAAASGAPITASVATGPVLDDERSKPLPGAALEAGGPDKAAASAVTASTENAASASEAVAPSESAASASEAVAPSESAASASEAVAPSESAASVSEAVARAAESARENGIDPALLSWQAPGPISVKPRPIQAFGRDRAGQTAKNQDKAPAAQRGMAPEETLWPLSDPANPVLSRFGWEDDPASGKRRWNAGVKIAAEPQTPVRAVLAGTVVYSGQREGSGHTVVLEHKDGYRSYYGSLEPGSVKIGDKIRAGAEFAKIAAEPLSPGNVEKSALLHFELKKGEMALNPESAISRNEHAG